MGGGCTEPAEKSKISNGNINKNHEFCASFFFYIACYHSVLNLQSSRLESDG
jgi:hypothetical protein